MKDAWSSHLMLTTIYTLQYVKQHSRDTKQKKFAGISQFTKKRNTAETRSVNITILTTHLPQRKC